MNIPQIKYAIAKENELIDKLERLFSDYEESGSEMEMEIAHMAIMLSYKRLGVLDNALALRRKQQRLARFGINSTIVRKLVSI